MNLPTAHTGYNGTSTVGSRGKLWAVQVGTSVVKGRNQGQFRGGRAGSQQQQHTPYHIPFGGLDLSLIFPLPPANQPHCHPTCPCTNFLPPDWPGWSVDRCTEPLVVFSIGSGAPDGNVPFTLVP